MVAEVLAGALAFLLPVTVGGGPAGNRRLTAILERGWWSRAVLAGFGTFPVLAGAALVAGHARKQRRGAAGRTPPPSAPVRPGPAGQPVATAAPGCTES